MEKVAPPDYLKFKKASFFSIQGQKEALTRAGKVLGGSLGLNKEQIIGTTKSPVLNTVLSTAATHPFITAAVATVGVTRLGLGVKMGGFRAATASSAVGAAGTTNSVFNVARTALPYIALGGAGAALASLLTPRGTSPRQTITPSLGASQAVTPNQEVDYGDAYTDNSIYQRAGRDIGALSQANPLTQSPSQYTPSSQATTQDTSAAQTASVGTNWLLVAGLFVGAYFLTNKQR
jgi:hypothetical protein